MSRGASVVLGVIAMLVLLAVLLFFLLADSSTEQGPTEETITEPSETTEPSAPNGEETVEKTLPPTGGIAGLAYERAAQ